MSCIDREVLTDLQEIQEDIAEYFTDNHFPISGETYWICVECLAVAKLAELRGELSAWVFFFLINRIEENVVLIKCLYLD